MFLLSTYTFSDIFSLFFLHGFIQTYGINGYGYWVILQRKVSNSIIITPFVNTLDQYRCQLPNNVLHYTLKCDEELEGLEGFRLSV